MQLYSFQKLIINILEEEFSTRESEQIFKYIIEDYFQQNYHSIKNHLLTDNEIEDLSFIIQKVCKHYPLQYIFNSADFYGLKLYVDENVLIPRAETEELVHLILKEHSNNKLTVLDIGTGSACIPIALKTNRNNWQVEALEISQAALKIALQNANNNNTSIQFYNDNILQPKLKYNYKYDIIVSNPPYVPTKEQPLMSTSTLQHEPKIALFVDNDNPLVFYEAIAKFAQEHLIENGSLYVEINEFYAKETVQVFQLYQFKNCKIINDLYNKPRIIKAQK